MNNTTSFIKSQTLSPNNDKNNNNNKNTHNNIKTISNSKTLTKRIPKPNPNSNLNSKPLYRRLSHIQ